MFDVKAVSDSMIVAVKGYVASAITKEVEPLLANQRDLMSRLDKQNQQLSALRKEVASLQRKLAGQKNGVVYA